MVKELNLQQTHPFVRYARYMYIVSGGVTYSETKGYDCRLFFVCKGKGKIMANGKIYELSKNDMIILPSGTTYHLIQPEESITYLAINFDFTFDFYKLSVPIPPEPVNSFKPENVLETVVFKNFEPFNSVFFIKDFPSAKTYLEKIESTYRKQKLFSELKASAELENILVSAARATLSSMEYKIGRSRDVNEMINYIQENYQQKITNEHIGKLFNYHPNYVNSLIKSSTGYSLHGYVLSVRIAKAIELLETSDLKISDIARYVGFEEIPHFSRYFKKITGKSPSYFKRKS